MAIQVGEVYENVNVSSVEVSGQQHVITGVSTGRDHKLDLLFTARCTTVQSAVL